ncbi:MAG: valine--tRNA ligase, partial [Pseudomonadota bacterium]
DRHRDAILRLARLSEARAAGSEVAPQGALQIVIDEATAFIPIAGLIDAPAERARLEKERGKAEGELKKTEARLSNQDFLAKAPEAVVEELRERQAAQTAQRDKLTEALARLEGL